MQPLHTEAVHHQVLHAALSAADQDHIAEAIQSAEAHLTTTEVPHHTAGVLHPHRLPQGRHIAAAAVTAVAEAVQAEVTAEEEAVPAEAAPAAEDKDKPL